MNTANDLLGHRFGYLTVVKRAPNKGYGIVCWECQCDCGNIREIRARSLVNGDTKSCGCHQLDGVITHGMSNTLEYRMWNGARRRAKANGIPFNIAINDIVIPEFCPVFPSIKLQSNTGGQQTDSSPTLDRLIPELGYTPSNITVISCRANRIKNNATIEELRQLVNWMQINLNQ